jgi:hypothetical protein
MFDVMAATLSGLGVALLFSLVPFVLAPQFAALLHGFGGPLPLITRLALRPWFAPLLAAPALALLVLAARRQPGRRRALLAAALVSMALAAVTVAYGLYGPIFELSGNIRAD